MRQLALNLATGLRSPAGGVAPSPVPGVPPALAAPVMAVASALPPVGRRRWLIAGVGAVLALAAVVAAVLALGGDRRPGGDSRNVVAPLAELVRLKVGTRPPGATVSIDGARRPGQTPLMVQLQSLEIPHLPSRLKWLILIKLLIKLKRILRN